MTSNTTMVPTPLWKNQSFADLMLDAASPAKPFITRTHAAADSALLLRNVLLALPTQGASHLDAVHLSHLQHACEALAEYADLERSFPYRSSSGDQLSKFLSNLKNKISGIPHPLSIPSVPPMLSPLIPPYLPSFPSPHPSPSPRFTHKHAGMREGDFLILPGGCCDEIDVGVIYVS